MRSRTVTAVYIVDAKGTIRHHQFGEGGYEQCERVIQRLLRDAGRDVFGDDAVAVDLDGFEVQADWTHLESPETYLGYQQGRNFASPGSGELDERRTYALPDNLERNQWALGGDWTIEPVLSVLNGSEGRLVIRFHARDVNLVRGPRPKERSVPFRVLMDGEPPGADHGLDVDENGNGAVVQQRLYQLICRRNGVDDSTFEITFLRPGAEAYCFTFG